MMYPYEYILKSNSTIDVHAEIAAEFMVMNHKHFSKDSVCIFTSVSGTTQETVAAAEYCKERGATTIALVAEPNTPLTQIADFCITTGSETHSFDTFFIFYTWSSSVSCITKMNSHNMSNSRRKFRSSTCNSKCC